MTVIRVLLILIFMAFLAVSILVGLEVYRGTFKTPPETSSEPASEFLKVGPPQPTEVLQNPSTMWRRDVEECFLTPSQIEVVRFSHNYGKPYDLSYTLAAIALKESNAGKWKINLQDPSGGLYHVTVDKAVKELGYEDTAFNRNRAIQALVNDDNLAAKIAVNEILFWREQIAGSWLDTWASYNHGWNGKNTERGQAYAEDIRQLIQKIQYCRWAY